MFSVSANYGVHFYNYTAQTLEITPSGTLTLAGDINFAGNLRSTNSLNVYSNIITSNTYAKTLGLTDITVATFVLQPYYSNTITINSPVSLYRQYINFAANGSLANKFYDTLNSITFTILKNGLTFATGTCTTVNSLPNTQIFVLAPSSTSTRSYEIFITDASCTFTPTISSTSDTYTINYTVNYSQNTSWQSYNTTMIAFGYYVNTDVAISGGPNMVTGSNGPNYASYNYSLTPSYSTNTAQLQINQISSNSINNQNTIHTSNFVSNNGTITNLNTTNITTNNLTTYNLNVSNLTSPNYLFVQQLTPAYMLDGSRSSGYIWSPITCSQYHLRSSDSDDSYIVYPAYKLIVYFNDGYSGTSATINNYSGTTPTYINSTSLYGGSNQINSCQLFYLNDSNEITNSLLS
jgi:hypothetical protein